MLIRLVFLFVQMESSWWKEEMRAIDLCQSTVGKRRIYIRRHCEYWGASSLRCAKSVPFEELHVVVREGRLGELIYCRT